MNDSLGKVVRKARLARGLTQEQLAELIGIDQRTILNIENHKGNPKFELLFPLVRTLKIDPSEIFYPELQEENPALHQLQVLMSDCSATEAATLVSVCQALLPTLRAQRNITIE